MKIINIYNVFSFNLLIIIIFDSYLVYSEYVVLKGMVYGLKLINLFVVLFLLRQNTLSNYKWLLGFIPLFYIYISSDVLLSLQLFYSAFLPVCCFLLLPDAHKKNIALDYINFVCFVCLVGLPIYVLVNFGLFPSLFTLYKDDKVYFNYLFFYWGREGILYRFSSIFDEPGVIGTLAPIIYFYFSKELLRWQKIVLNLAAICSLSMFYFITIFPVLIFANLRNLNKKQGLLRLFYFFLGGVLCYFLLTLVALWSQSNPALSLALYHRFIWEGDFIVGIVNNRDVGIVGFDVLFDKWSDYSSIEFYIGYGKNYITSMFGGSTLSYKTVVIERGILIVLYLFIHFSFMHQTNSKIFNIISILFLVSVFFQRPILYAVNYYVLIFVGLVLFEKESKV